MYALYVSLESNIIRVLCYVICVTISYLLTSVLVAAAHLLSF